MISDAAHRALMARSWRFDHAYLLDERDALKAAMARYIAAMRNADAFARALCADDISEAITEALACIDNARSTAPREDVLDWFES